MDSRKTKIICTVGPATAGVDNLVKLINAGMDVARVNFSHGTHEQHQEAITQIREAAKIVGKPIGIIQDLQGPKIRTNKVRNGSVMLEDGAEFILTVDKIDEGDEKRVSTNYEPLAGEVSHGNKILIDDGYIILEVQKVRGKEIYTKVIKGGALKNNKGIITPGVANTAPSLSSKDLEDLKFGLQADIDAVALSFVRSERDVLELKTTMKIFGRQVPIIAKIERLEAYTDIEEIIRESDAIMVARGDLGLEMDAEKVPVMQKEIIAKCNYYGKPVITATQMLESMITNPRPTRAEASDVANAVLDGTDCVMLSAETSVGSYPFDAVDYMNKIILEAETLEAKKAKLETPSEINSNIADALARAACVMAQQIGATAIVPLTYMSGTAKLVAKHRPKTDIIALTPMESTQQTLTLVWGVRPQLVPQISGEEDPSIFDEFLLKTGKVKIHDYVVYVSGARGGSQLLKNTIKIRKVGE